MNFSNETQTRNSSLVNVSKKKKKGTIYGTTVHSKMSIPADLKVKDKELKKQVDQRQAQTSSSS